MGFISPQAISILGSGVSWPIQLVNGRPKIDTGIPLIESSMKMVLSWPMYTRVMIYLYGSRINELLEEQNTLLLENVLGTFFKDTLTQWEPRVEFMGIDFEDTDDDKIDVKVHYRIITQAKADSFVFPFYRNILY